MQSSDGAGNRTHESLAMTFGRAFLLVLGLYTWTVAARLYSVLGSERHFWVARGTTAGELLWTIFIVLLLTPVALAVAAGVFMRLPWKPAWIPGYAILVLFSTLAVAEAFRNLGLDVALVWSGVAGVVLTLILCRYSTPRFLVSAVAPGALVVAVLLVLQPGARSILESGQPGAVRAGQVGNPVPIVFVVFDGLPTTLMMDVHGDIDQERFPNFRRLARMSTWFRDATTVADNTVTSVTSILTGLYPDPLHRRAAVYRDYPLNLLSVLPQEYQKLIFEQHALLSPSGSDDLSPLPARIQENLEDLTLIYLHAALPGAVTARLPAVDQTWRGFWRHERPHLQELRPGKARADFHLWVRKEVGPGNPDRVGRFKEFLERLPSSAGQGLFYFKGKLPHRPWEYLPSGRRYPPYRNARMAYKSHEPYQRHLLQSMYVDALLGQLLDRLQSLEWADNALWVVTADHGVGFKKGRQSRRVSQGNYCEIISIPLFVRLPGQRSGKIVNGPVESVDIFPTILSVLELPLESEFHGEDLLAERAHRSVHHFVDDELPTRNTMKFSHEDFLRQREKALKRKKRIFGAPADPWGIFRIGPQAELVGERLSRLAVSGVCRSQARLDDASVLHDVDLDAGAIPALLRGRTSPEAPQSQLAVAVNGIIGATTTTFTDAAGHEIFSTMIPESLLKPGYNDVVLLEISPGEDPDLGRCPQIQ